MKDGGHIWEQGVKSTCCCSEVEADPYLLHVSRSIHRNPLEAGFTEPLERYRWSSYAAYVPCVCPEPGLQRHHVLAMALGVRSRKARG
jgi:hypothetical protein